MRITSRIALLVLAPLCAQAAAANPDPDPEKARLAEAKSALDSSSGRFALAATLSPVYSAAAASRNDRFALNAHLAASPAPVPGKARYTLRSQLGDGVSGGSCGGALPDALFRNGFEN